MSRRDVMYKHQGKTAGLLQAKGEINKGRPQRRLCCIGATCHSSFTTAAGATAPGQTISDDVTMIYVLLTILAWGGGQPNFIFVRRVVNIKDLLAVCVITEVLP